MIVALGCDGSAEVARVVAGGRNDDAGLPLYGFEQDGDGSVGDGVADGFGVPVGDNAEAGGEWAEAAAGDRIGRGADDGRRAAVEVAGGDVISARPSGRPLTC